MVSVSHNSSTDEVSQQEESVDIAEEDHLEDVGILFHGGWCIKRARDDIQKVPTVIEVITTASDSMLVKKKHWKKL